MISVDKAKQLHERFFLCDLTQAELAELAAFVASPACPAEWSDERHMFASMLASKRLDSNVQTLEPTKNESFWFDRAPIISDDAPALLPDGFADRLSAHIQATVAKRENEEAEIAIFPVALPAHKPRAWKWLVSISTLAACLTVAAWLGLRLTYNRTVVVHRPLVAEQSPMESVASSQPKQTQPFISEPSMSKSNVQLSINPASTSITEPAVKHKQALSTISNASTLTETQRAFYVPTADNAAEAEEQLRLIVNALQEAHSEVAMLDSLVLAMDWDAWQAATYDSDLLDN